MADGPRKVEPGRKTANKDPLATNMTAERRSQHRTTPNSKENIQMSDYQSEDGEQRPCSVDLLRWTILLLWALFLFPVVTVTFVKIGEHEFEKWRKMTVIIICVFGLIIAFGLMGLFNKAVFEEHYCLLILSGVLSAIGALAFATLFALLLQGDGLIHDNTVPLILSGIYTYFPPALIGAYSLLLIFLFILTMIFIFYIRRKNKYAESPADSILEDSVNVEILSEFSVSEYSVSNSQDGSRLYDTIQSDS